ATRSNGRGRPEPRRGPAAEPGRPKAVCVRVCFARSCLFGRARWHVKLVALILGTALIDAHRFYRGVQIRDPQIANGAGHVEYELAHTHRSCQSLWRNKHFAGEKATQ